MLHEIKGNRVWQAKVLSAGGRRFYLKKKGNWTNICKTYEISEDIFKVKQQR